jgi:PAS domain S-box-containing protein
MDANSILAKTAKGIVQAKTEDGDLNYDAVRLLRLVNGKASIAELRLQFKDLTDTRFQKAVTTLEEKKLIHILAAHEADTGEYAELRKLDEQVQDLAQEVVQTLDFTKLERGLLSAAQSSPPAAGAAKTRQANGRKPPPAVPQGAAAHARPETEAKARPSREPPGSLNAEARAKLVAELRPKVEEELHAKLIAELRPKIEQELRHKLVAALRPVLEAEIRARLTAALEPRVKRELRNRVESKVTHAAQEQTKRGREPPSRAGALPEPPDVTAAVESRPDLRLLECIRETVFQTDLAGNSNYVNARWTILSGYRSEETLGRPLAQFFVLEDQRGVADYLDGVARGRAVPVIFEARLARKAGAPLRVAMRAAPLTTTSGASTGVCGTLRGMA